MWTPDTQTLFLILVIVNAFLTLMLFTYWKSQTTYSGFRTWMLALLVTTIGYILYLLRGTIPDLLSIVVANVLVLLTLLLRIDTGWRFFRSGPIPPKIYTLLIPYTICFLYFTFVVNTIFIRNILLAICIPSCIFISALPAFLSDDRKTRLLRYGFGGALVAAAVTMAIRYAMILQMGNQFTLFEPDLQNTASFVVLIITDILSTGFFLMLNMARAQDELQASEERYRNLADTLPDYVVVHDGNRILYTNPAASKIVALDSEKLIGESIFAFLTEESANTSRNHLDAIQGGKNSLEPVEIQIRIPNGTIRHCIVKTATMVEKGRPVFLSVITDISERMRAELALKQVNSKLKLLSSITRHDIKNQVTALQLFIQLSEEAKDDPIRLEEFVEREKRIVDTIGSQINFTKDYEEMGVASPVWQDVGDIMNRVRATLPLRNIQVEVKISGLEVYADPLLEKVFYNLIDNALRYGGPDMTRILVTNQESETGIRIIIEDDGVGVSVEDKPRLFQKGFGKNTGLGLFLSREILSITGITIKETGTAGHGARFEIHVPNEDFRIITHEKNSG